MMLVNGGVSFPLTITPSSCLFWFTLYFCCPVSGGESPLHLSWAASGPRMSSAVGHELVLMGGDSLACRTEGWLQLAGTPNVAGMKPFFHTPFRAEAAGTEASRQRAWFIKSHQEHHLGTAVIYLHFFLVKCY